MKWNWRFRIMAMTQRWKKKMMMIIDPYIYGNKHNNTETCTNKSFLDTYSWATNYSDTGKAEWVNGHLLSAQDLASYSLQAVLRRSWGSSEAAGTLKTLTLLWAWWAPRFTGKGWYGFGFCLRIRDGEGPGDVPRDEGCPLPYDSLSPPVGKPDPRPGDPAKLDTFWLSKWDKGLLLSTSTSIQ